MTEAKAAARRRAAAVRAAAHDPAASRRAAAALSAFLADHAGQTLAGYIPIRTEADPGPVLAAWSGRVALPVVEAPGRPLAFRAWRAGEPLIPGAFGVPIPAAGPSVVPDILIVPLLAFDGSGCRLGYGGGFYDRTLAALRSGGGKVVAVGFAYAAQRVDDLPREATDAALDAVVTETGPERFGAR